ncbi:MAG: hypothetical protein B7Z55_02790, partial [Planctomycetales bacterium 12-60-4]
MKMGTARLRIFCSVICCLSAAVSHAVEPEYEWELITLQAPWAPRDGAGVLSFQGKIWLLGGWNP